MESTTTLDVGLEALDLLTVGEVAARMRVSPVTVRRLIASDDLEAVRIGRLVRVPPRRSPILRTACAEPPARSQAKASHVPEMSDEELRAPPSSANLATAARALGIGSTKAYQLARAGKFPCPVLLSVPASAS
jgi:excisionase family DNA binding protein